MRRINFIQTSSTLLLKAVLLAFAFMAIESCSKKEEKKPAEETAEATAAPAPVAPVAAPVVRKTPAPTKAQTTVVEKVAAAVTETASPEAPAISQNLVSEVVSTEPQPSVTATPIPEPTVVAPPVVNEPIPTPTPTPEPPVGEPLLLAPQAASVITNSNLLDIVGSCSSAYVKIAGDVVALDMILPSGSYEQPCVGGAFNFKVQKIINGSYIFNFTGLSASRTVESLPTKLTWTLDVEAPASLTLNQPASNPFSSADSSLSLAGNCEADATVALSGTSTAVTTCSQQGTFSFDVAGLSDGTHNFVLIQVDKAGNSSPQLALQWVRIATIPPAPTITAPAEASYRSKGPNLTLQGLCESGFVTLSGNVTAAEVVIPAGSLETSCQDGNFSFTITKATTGTYEINVAAKALLNAPASAAATVIWNLDLTAPFDPVLTKPAVSPYFSSDSDLLIQGSCENDATVTLGGDSSLQTVCADQTFSFVVAGLEDGTYNFNVTQNDAVGNSSGQTLLTWTRNTALPSALIISSPSGAVAYTKTGTLSLTGECVNSMQVVLSGDVAAADMMQPAGSLTQICSNSNFTFLISKAGDGQYNLQLTQVDTTFQLTSPASSLTWIRDTIAPAAPVLSSPLGSTFVSGDDEITIAGSCEADAVVKLSGAANQEVGCSDSHYSFTFASAVDGSYNFSLTQIDKAGNISEVAPLTWTRDTVIPSSPVVNQPEASPFFSSASTLTVSGVCVEGYTVSLSGDVVAADVMSPDESLTQVCSGATFSFQIEKTSDQLYTFQFTQKNPANGKSSAPTTLKWNRDTTAPLTPTITKPLTSPITSGDSFITLEGGCEIGARVELSGAATVQKECLSGVYNFSLNQTVDGSYGYQVAQVDQAGNRSEPASFVWIREPNIPLIPTITTPAVSVYSSNGSTLTISGSCTTSNIVHLDGPVTPQEVLSPSGSLTMTCSGSAYSFTVQKGIDGIYDFSVQQENIVQDPETSEDISYFSAQDNVRWIRDTVAPAAVTKTQPAVSPYTASGNLVIAGRCEPSARVSLSGSDSQAVTCSSSGNYSFTIVGTVDGAYSYSIHQTDVAGNSSSTISQQWTRDSSVPASPIVTLPAASPYNSNSSTLTISGNCLAGIKILLSGDVVASEVSSPAGALSQYCQQNGTFSFVINKSSDGTYTFNLQSSNGTYQSGATTLVWNRDATAPIVTLTGKPSSINYSMEAAFSFTVNDADASFECSLDSAAFASCGSPLTYSNLANGMHSLRVQAKDSSGNLSSVASYSWQQDSHKTIALYHFNTGAELIDSSLYTGAENNTLTDMGTGSNTSSTNIFGAARTFAGGQYVQAPDNISQDQIKKRLTLEAWVKFTTLPSRNGYATIFAKDGNAAGSYGWVFSVVNNKSKVKLAFSASLNGTSLPTEVSKQVNVNLTTNKWYHVAVTFNLGSVKFFLNGVNIGTASLGTSGTAQLFSPATPLRMGSKITGANPFIGLIDEARISQVVRWNGTFPTPTAEYSAD
jgi:hypothetical protein